MLIKDVCLFLEEKFPLSLQEDYDNCGLIVGDGDTEVSGILLALDVTPEVLEEAVAAGSNLIVAHHPLIFKGMKRIGSNDPVQKMVIYAIRNGISVYAVHTCLDNSFSGLNEFLGKKLNLKNIRILDQKKEILYKLVVFCPDEHVAKVREALFNAGAGHIGNYDQCSFNLAGEGSFRANEDAKPFVGKTNELHFEKEIRIEVILPSWLTGKILRAIKDSHPYEEPAYDIYPLKNTFSGAGSGIIGETGTDLVPVDFLSIVKNVTGIPVIKHSRMNANKIKRVAICTGSGAFMIKNAFEAGADIFLTADLKYHDFFEYQDRMIIADIGHFESEQFVKDLLMEIFIKKFPNFAILVSKTVTNPVNYF